MSEEEKKQNKETIEAMSIKNRILLAVCMYVQMKVCGINRKAGILRKIENNRINAIQRKAARIEVAAARIALR